MSSTDLSFSLLVLSYNRREALAHTLERLRAIDYPNVETLVFDNGSSDGSADMIAAEYPEVRLIRSATNVGIVGINRAAEQARGDVLVVLDDDSYLEPDALRHAAERLGRDPTVGILAFRILLRDGRNITEHWEQSVPSFWGCGAAIRRSVWLAAGGYDPTFFLYLNEVDLAMRVRAAGHDVAYEPSCVAHHLVLKSNRAGGRLIYYSARNAILMQVKSIPWRYLPRTLSAHLLSFFSLALISRQPWAWARGVAAGLRDLPLALRRRRPVPVATVRFHLRNDFMWKWPHQQWWIKRSQGGLNTDMKTV